MPEFADLFGAIGRVAGVFTQAPGAAHVRIWEEIRPWLGRLVIHAGPKWLPRLALGLPCQVPVYVRGVPRGACSGSAISACDVCGRMCCLDHSRIDQLGDAICYLCCAEAKARSVASGAGPKTNPWAEGEAKAKAAKQAPVEDAAWARGVLGVDVDTPWDEIKTAHRKLSAKWHPDVHRGEKKKEKAAERFKQVQRALDLLQKEREKAAAA